MRVPSSDRKPLEVQKVPLQKVPLEDTLERIRATLQFDSDEWQSVLGITQKEQIRMSAKSQAPSAQAILQLAEHLNLNFESILRGEIDYGILAARRKGNDLILPEKYTVGAFSKLRTSSHLLGYLESFYGWRSRVRVLRHFQISEATLQTPDSNISIRFLTDLCDWLIKNQYPKELIFNMGKYSVVSNFHSPLGDQFRKCSSTKEMYENLFSDLAKRYYDRNHRYRLISLSESECVVEATNEPDVLEALKAKTLGSPQVCLVRSGGFSSIPGYLRLPHAEVQEIACQHRGDAACRFRITYGNSAFH